MLTFREIPAGHIAKCVKAVDDGTRRIVGDILLKTANNVHPFIEIEGSEPFQAWGYVLDGYLFEDLGQAIVLCRDDNVDRESE